MKEVMQIYLIIFGLLISPAIAVAQHTVHGQIVTKLGKPISGASIFLKSEKTSAISGSSGEFRIFVIDFPETLAISHLGYISKEIPIKVDSLERFNIQLEKENLELDEVRISTGYEEVSKERATGAFERIDRKLLNRSVSTGILDRLEGISSSLNFDKRNVSENGLVRPVAVIRGISSINANISPLIVVDNFPYEGDINNINPDDIENITLLKDAAASSIWGAKAGNGVIVITTKTGKGSRHQISLNSSFSLTPKPNLFYDQGYIRASEFINIERQLFEQGFYKEDDRTPLSPVIEALFRNDRNLENLVEYYEGKDIRKEAEQYLYRNSTSFRNSVGLRGGADLYNYYISLGNDKNSYNIINDRYSRTTLTTNTLLKPLKKLSLTLGLSLISTNQQNGGLSISDLRSRGLYPYAQLVDDDGKPLPIPTNYRMKYIMEAEKNGLLNWGYYPLDEIEFDGKYDKYFETRVNAGLNYELLKGLDLDVKFQYQLGNRELQNLRYEGSYYTRDLINKFTQPDGSKPFPTGDIVSLTKSQFRTYSGRVQLNFDRKIKDNHRITSLAGMEILESKTSGNTFSVYGFDNDILTFQSRIDYNTRFYTLPTGRATIPLPDNRVRELLDRYISYYSNGTYSYADRYIVSGSARLDGSNLFGVKTNQKRVPLWSTGISWILSNEGFYTSTVMPFLKLRATFGYSGNIDRSTTAYPTGSYLKDYVTSLNYVAISTAGNPQLRWEKVRTMNFGADFSSKNKRLSGSLEYFNKHSADLLGNIPLDPTSGYFLGSAYTYRLNYADMVTKGLETTISSRNLFGNLGWNLDLTVSYITDRITDYKFEEDNVATYLSTYVESIPRLGYPAFGLYSYPWNGLNPETGNPQVLVNGEISEDYSTYVRDIQIDDLVYHGSQIPRHVGSLRNTFSYKGLELSANIDWKAGYFFRRKSIDYSDLFSNWRGHADYYDRWKKPGDEVRTNVPSQPEKLVSNRDLVYIRSEVLVDRGDHIRLRDIHLSYLVPKSKSSRLPIQSFNVYLHAQNLGILWKSTSSSIDPESPYSKVMPKGTVSLGLNVNL